ncbi:TPA: 50S ribosomal protein L35 [Candidatus Dependentiae bacterium]|nr:MAG: 50S ribosomal protein L35 [candidate division TM6 bacterium GW2011_GWF2_43_87]HBL98704.1 50S ribosomal protein L35 [Candidatus Dependentiae bacterium]
MATKAKTHSGASKRFEKLKSGLIKFSRGYRRHLLTGKTAKRKRQLRGGSYLNKCDAGHVASLI